MTVSIADSTDSFDFDTKCQDIFMDPQATLRFGVLNLCYEINSSVEDDKENLSRVIEAFAQVRKQVDIPAPHTKSDYFAEADSLLQKLALITECNDLDQRISTIMQSSLFTQLTDDIRPTDFQSFNKNYLIPKYVLPKEMLPYGVDELHPEILDWYTTIWDLFVYPGKEKRLPDEIYIQYVDNFLNDIQFSPTFDFFDTPPLDAIVELDQTTIKMNELISLLQTKDIESIREEAPAFAERIEKFDEQYHSEIMLSVVDDFNEWIADNQNNQESYYE